MKRLLLLVPLGLALNVAIFVLSPYREIAAALAPMQPFEASPTESLRKTTERLGLLDDTGRAQYVAMQGWDVGAILGNAMILLPLLLAGATFAGVPRRLRGLVLIAGALPLALDLLENAFVLTLLRAVPLTESICTNAALATTAKWMAFFGAAGLIVVLWLAALLKRLRAGAARASGTPTDDLQRGRP